MRRTMNLIEQISKPGVSRSLMERTLAQAGLGIVHALRSSSMSIADAEANLFNIETYRIARRRHYDRRLVEFIEWGMELADVAELAPEGVEESYAKMERLLQDFIRFSLAPNGKTQKERGKIRKIKEQSK